MERVASSTGERERGGGKERGARGGKRERKKGGRKKGGLEK